MKKVAVDLAILYSKYNGNLIYGEIETVIQDGIEYYDLYTNGQLVCMDGEECEVLETNENFTTLKNINGELETTFKLTIQEFKIAAYEVIH